MTIRPSKPWALLLGLALAGCTSPQRGGDDDDSAAGDDDDSAAGDDDDSSSGPVGTVCHGDSLADDVPLDDDLDNLRERWDLNSELLGILFLGEPL